MEKRKYMWNEYQDINKYPIYSFFIIYTFNLKLAETLDILTDDEKIVLLKENRNNEIIIVIDNYIIKTNTILKT